VSVHKHRSPLSFDQFFFHDLFLQSTDEKFKSPTVNTNYEVNLQNSQALPPNSTRSKFFPPQLSHHYLLLHSCFSSLSVSLSLFTIQTRRADHSDLVDGHLWTLLESQKRVLFIAAGIGLESSSTRQGKYGVRSGDAPRPPPPRPQSCFEDAGRLF
jgi:hypothetical protein